MPKKKQSSNVQMMQFDVNIPGLPVPWKEVKFKAGGIRPIEQSVEYAKLVQIETDGVVFKHGVFKIDKKYAVSISIQYLFQGEKEFNNKPPSLSTLNKSIMNGIKKVIPQHLVYEFVTEKRYTDGQPCVGIQIVLNPCF